MNNLDKVMETDTISKNEINKQNFFVKICFVLLAACVIVSAGYNRIAAQTIIKNDSIKPYINFLENNKFLSAKEYILSKFETNDIVILSERIHQDMTQYDVILNVVKDERFKGHIYTEIGHENLHERFNKFLLNSSLTKEEKEKELLNIYRDLCPSLLWGAYNYYYMLSEVWEMNKNRKMEDKILIFPLDITFDYNNIQTYRERNIIYWQIFNRGDRDLTIGRNFVTYYEKVKKEKKKALVILNTMHGYKQMPTYLPLPTRPLIRFAGEFIYKTYPDKTFNIYINCTNMDNGKLPNHGIIDAAFEYTKKNDAGFDLKNTPVGNTKFDLFDFADWFKEEGYDTNINYDYIFDGMIFYKPLREMIIKVGIPDIYSKEYEDMFLKRIALTMNKTLENDKEYIEAALKEVNTPVEIPLDKWFDVESWAKQIKKWIE
jgi:hypothetical protein